MCSRREDYPYKQKVGTFSMQILSNKLLLVATRSSLEVVSLDHNLNETLKWMA